MSIDPVVIKKFQDMKEMHVPFCAATNMPFVTCDEESFNDQIWVFTNLDDVNEFAQKFAEKKIILRDIIVKKEEFQIFFADLHSMGINEIVFCENHTEYKIDFSKFVKTPDYSKIPANQRPLLNPQLQLSTIYFFQEIKRPGVAPDKEKLEPLAEEMYANLAKSKFLMPAATNKNEEGKDILLFPVLTDKNGKQFQPIFSDHAQYMKYLRKNKPVPNARVLLVGIEELQKYLSGQVQGYMLNPDSYCHILTKQLLTTIQQRF